MTVYYLCPDSNHPTGGIQVIYRHVDILNRHGMPAYVLHQKHGFRCTWFENNTQVAYTRFPLGSMVSRIRNKVRERFNPGGIKTIPVVNAPSREIGADDVLVLPEARGPELASIGRGIPRVILNQNGFLTFKRFSFSQATLNNPYAAPSVRAVMVNSEHCEEYVRHAFPGVDTRRFYLSVDPALFHFQAQKKKQICFSQIKNAPDALQVVNILKFRGVLADFKITPFINVPQERVAALMRESLIFLSLGNREGFGLPAAEAMACGCIVIGYHGWGGKEFFKEEFSFPVEDGDILGFARRVEEVIRAYSADESYLLEQRRSASQFIAEEYSPEREERELVQAWKQILRG